MSAAIKTNRTRKWSASAPALWLVLGLAAAFFLVRYWQEVLMEHDLNAKIAVQTGLNTEMDEENRRLAASLEYYRSDKYIEQRAREDLNLRRTDEEVLIPIGEISPEGVGSTGNTGGSAASTPEDEHQGDNWLRWFGLFAPFEGSP